MDDRLQLLFTKYINDRLIQIIASNPVTKDGVSKLKLRPVLLRGELMYQAAESVGKQEFHRNYTCTEAVAMLCERVGKPFRQIEIKGTDGNAVILVGKKGNLTIKEHKAAGKVSSVRNGNEAEQNTGAAGAVCEGSAIKEHNRTKKYILSEGMHIPFMVDLGIMTPAGKVVNAKYDKFRQINRYLEFIEDILPSLPKGRELSIVDFGCGKSYLTFAMYYYLHELKGLDIRVTGLDLKKEVIEHCNALAERYSYEKLNFLHGDIADYTCDGAVDMVVTLHACDTATDYALYKAIKWGAAVILCVPCCQHELNKQIKNDIFANILRYGLIKERMSALITDGLRALMLEECGYRTQILEFIDMEHTPKNILIRAVRQPLAVKASANSRKLLGQLNAELTLQRLLEGEKN